MSDSFYSFGSILLEILSFVYRHLLAFCIEAGLVCKRTINFKLETQVKKNIHCILHHSVMQQGTPDADQ